MFTTEKIIIPKDYKLCECNCGQLIPIINKMNKPARFKQGHYIKKFLQDNRHPHFKGGRLKTIYGYIMIWVGEKYVFEHREVMKQILGRELKPKERVHHKNHIKDDNRPENLLLVEDNGKHIKDFHVKPDSYFHHTCFNCKTNHTSIDKSRNRPSWVKYKDGFLCVKCYRKMLYHKNKGNVLPF